MELQNHDYFKTTFKPSIDLLHTNELLSLLHKKRDFLVHRGMLEVLSKGRVGTTEGRIVKMAMGFHVDSAESTLQAYERFKELCGNDKSIRGLLGPDCDSRPYITREWKIQEFPNIDMLDLSIEAWTFTGKILSRVILDLGDEKLDLSFSCRHEPSKVRTVEFGQREFFMSVDGIDINA